MTGVEDIAMTTTHDLSMIGLFSQATWVVKSIIILLLACSFWSWTIIFAKLTLLGKLKRMANKFEDAFWNSGSIDIFFDNLNTKSDDPFVAVFVTGMKEWRRAKSTVKTVISGISLEDRVMRVMRVTVGREISYLENHLGFLATVGSTAPFVGLFGTVWGIMHVIGGTQSFDLASVAPGIAEALFATALGLIVTIPAVVAYNKIANEINKYQDRLESFVDEFSAIIARQMEDSGV